MGNVIRHQMQNVSSSQTSPDDIRQRFPKMYKPEFISQLIDTAAKNAGSDYALAKMLETTRQTVSNWRHHIRPVPLADVALLAAVAEQDPAEMIARYLVCKHKNTPKGDKLKKALQDRYDWANSEQQTI